VQARTRLRASRRLASEGWSGNASELAERTLQLLLKRKGTQEWRAACRSDPPPANFRVPKIVAVSLLIASVKFTIAHTRPPNLPLASGPSDAAKIENALSASPKFITEPVAAMDWPSAQDKTAK
jgi:hypothetical protein